MPPGETTCSRVTLGFSNDYLQGRGRIGHGKEGGKVGHSVGFYETGPWVGLECFLWISSTILLDDNTLLKT